MREAVSAEEEAALTFQAELKKITRRKNAILGKFSTISKQAFFLKENAQQDLYSQQCKTGTKI